MGERERVVCMQLRTQAGEQHSAHAQSIGRGLSLDVSGQEKLHYIEAGNRGSLEAGPRTCAISAFISKRNVGLPLTTTISTMLARTPRIREAHLHSSPPTGLRTARSPTTTMDDPFRRFTSDVLAA